MTTELTPQLSEEQRTELFAKVAKGTVDLPAVLKTLAVAAPSPLPVAKVPLPAVITDAQKEALAKLQTQFGSVVPTEARALTTDEVVSLLDERETLDSIEKMATKRKDGIRTAVLNHIDAEWRKSHPDESVDQDKEGHVLVAQKVAAPERETAFSWEVSNRGGDLNPQALEELLDHDTWLSITTQTRVVDATKVLQALKKNPGLLDVLGNAVTKTSKVGSLYVRKAD